MQSAFELVSLLRHGGLLSALKEGHEVALEADHILPEDPVDPGLRDVLLDPIMQPLPLVEQN